ncbi:hypothetical protein VN24_20495 [Paenibacillus beijingensis]|uniref:Uncharacterized protein n=1 Tax=Paenibacillus beijingensis TaxID=1126833 RepID=A0A0D5NMF2_9BACL|nr:hypothetical protein VN24_20495 [Paenibacillus beijingensis]
MGEEKPDEELMGKRKPSPRLSTASLDADIFIIAGIGVIIHTPGKVLPLSQFCPSYALQNGKISAIPSLHETSQNRSIFGQKMFLNSLLKACYIERIDQFVIAYKMWHHER